MRTGRISLLVLSLAVAGVLVGVMPGGDESRVRAQDEDAGSQIPDETGPALVEAMGLTFISQSPVRGCHRFVSFDDGAQAGGYCLDGYVESDLGLFEVWHRLNGHIPTALEREVFQLQRALARAEGEPDVQEQLIHQLDPLLRELESLPDWGGLENVRTILEYEGP